MGGRRQKGFALVFVLTLTLFAVVLLGAWTMVLVLQAGDTRRERATAEARAQARHALETALSRLQETAGADRALTARADITGSGLTHPRWTGVWRADDPGGMPVWLVSGEDIDPAATLADSAELDGVEAGWVNVPTGGAIELDVRVAWRVEDEGVKASLLPSARPAQVSAELVDEAERSRLARLLPGRALSEDFFSALPSDALYDVWSEEVTWGEETLPRREALARLLSKEQAALLPGMDAEELREAEADLTDRAHGVLASTTGDGLRVDLTAFAAGAEVPGSLLPLGDTLRDFLNVRPDAAGRFVPVAPDAQGRGSRHLAPTDLALYLGLFHRGEALELHWILTLEAWNPLAAGLVFTPTNTADFTVQFTDLPVVLVEWESARGTPQARSGLFFLDLAAEMPAVAVDVFDGFMGAGEVRFLRTDATDTVNAGPVTLASAAPGAGAGDSYVRFTLTDQRGAPLGFRLLQGGAEVVRVEGLTVGLASREFPLRAVPAAGVDYGDLPLRLHARLDDRALRLAGETESPLEIYLTEGGPRAPVQDARSAPWSSLWEGTADPFAEVAALQAPTAFFHDPDRSAPNALALWDEAPVQEPVSVGLLWHFPGVDWTAFLDRAFFSTVPRASGLWEPRAPLDPEDPAAGYRPLPNSRLAVSVAPGGGVPTLQALQGIGSAEHFLVEGAFNANSTSVAAWAAVLGGVNAYAVDLTGTVKPRLQTALPRLRHTAEGALAHPVAAWPGYPEGVSAQQRAAWYRDGDPAAPWRRAFAHGIRELTMEERASLAREIVTRLQARGRPFGSLEELAASGLLDEALAAAGVNATSQGEIPRGAPAHVDGEDIVANLAPVLFARSDTFTLYGAAEVRNPRTGAVEARAFCRATAQRLPVRVDGEDAALEATGFGRRFVLRDFRWLDASGEP